MPRRRRQTMAGAPAQAPGPIVDGTYGDGEAALEAQRRMPTPDYSPSTSPGGATGASGPGPSGPGALDPQSRMAQAVALLGRMSPGRPLDAATERPGEPLTVGMAQGPGPGPEILSPGDRATRTLRMLAEYSDDPGLAELADIAQRMGR